MKQTVSNTDATDGLVIITHSGRVLFENQAKQSIATIDGAALVVTTIEGVYITTLHNGFGTALTTVNASAEGSVIVAGSCTGDVLAWNTHDDTCLLANRAGAYAIAPIRDIECSPHGTYLAALTTASQVQVWDIQQRLCLYAHSVGDETMSLAWAEDEMCVIGCPSNEVLVVLTPPPSLEQTSASV